MTTTPRRWRPAGPAGSDWSVLCVDLTTGRRLVEHDPGRPLRTASVAKLFVLAHLAGLLDRGEISPTLVLSRRAVPAVSDSGLWQHLETDALPVVDVARLVAAVSDNLATNVLLDHLGLTRVQDTARRLAPGGSMLHDVVRDRRGPGDPGTLSTGCAEDWVGFLAGLPAGSRLLDWLAAGVDLSLVAAAFDLDPLAHDLVDLGVRLRNKTGTDAGVRADIGLVEHDGRRLAYAAICNWPDAGGPSDRAVVLRGMRELGEVVRAHLTAG